MSDFLDNMLESVEAQLDELERRYADIEDQYLERMALRAVLTAPPGTDVEKMRARLEERMPREARKALRAAVDSKREPLVAPPPLVSSEDEAGDPEPTSVLPPGGRATLGELMAAEGLGIEEQEITEEQARDVFAQQKGGEFTSQVLMDEYDISRTQANKYLDEYCGKGIIQHVRGRGAQARYTYVPPPDNAPSRRPRSDGPRDMARKANGGPVAGTGKSRVNTSVTGTRRPGRTHGGKPRA